MKKLEKYFSKHVYLNSFSYALIGMGLGILLTHDFFDPHPVRYGIFFFILGIIGNIYAYKSKK